jgi:hypothetical protein
MGGRSAAQGIAATEPEEQRDRGDDAKKHQHEHDLRYHPTDGKSQHHPNYKEPTKCPGLAQSKKAERHAEAADDETSLMMAAPKILMRAHSAKTNQATRGKLPQHSRGRIQAN